jgi:hypothetical protein
VLTPTESYPLVIVKSGTTLTLLLPVHNVTPYARPVQEVHQIVMFVLTQRDLMPPRVAALLDSMQMDPFVPSALILVSLVPMPQPF